MLFSIPVRVFELKYCPFFANLTQYLSKMHNLFWFFAKYQLSNYFKKLEAFNV